VAVRTVDLLTGELVGEPEDIDRRVTIKGFVDTLGVFYKAIMPKRMPSRLVTDEESHGRKPLLGDFFLFRMN
jgi:hypothetical protein